MEETAFPP